MSILIKGMDMPESCYECAYSIERVGICSITQGGCEWGHNRPPNCPLIEIPTPHGRLIDRSVLFEEYQNLCNGLLCRDCPFFKENSCSIEEWILNQPPILEAEEKP